jgi:hypothetical protein
MTLMTTGQKTQFPNLEIIYKKYSDVTDKNDNMLIPWYLMACYAYYVEDEPILEDAMFDRLSKKLLKVFDDVEHIHKDYITKEMLEAGTYLGEYPSRIKYAVKDIQQSI